MLFWTNYKNWLKIADTSLPRNIFGYVLVVCLKLLKSDSFTLKPYDDPKEIAKCGIDIGKRSFLKEKLPERNGPRPSILKFIAPNRQTSQKADEAMHKLLAKALDNLVAEHSAHVVVKTSTLEKSGDALFIHDNIITPHQIAKKTKREIAHVHTGANSGDYSLHLCLSPTDCKEVISKQWGERMGLAGTLVPQEYLLIYTPRTEEEVAVVKNIVESSIMFMTGGRDFID
ncbi:hypothetical protein D0Z07_1882 [Hyphodiscus hymeniophilus]|uniref:Luciferase domain-containing protein n=1 Tax=Hyphodiscus hymeniophilus TaxID=353542 RepID=A0A9P6VPC6_9HELO|nr:hypothetical protein D0Z07_1882 [Hyphodiscus hymeniophilus]